MKNNIRLNVIHPEKARVESFLNNVDEEIEQIPFDPLQLTGVDESTAAFRFKVKRQSTFVMVVFATSYFDAIKIEAANLLVRPEIKWTINGSILFGVESLDEHASGQMLSFFAGRE